MPGMDARMRAIPLFGAAAVLAWIAVGALVGLPAFGCVVLAIYLTAKGIRILVRGDDL
jgi:hypothetical protein